MATAAPIATPATGDRVISSADRAAEHAHEQELDGEHHDARPPVAGDQVVVSYWMEMPTSDFIVRRGADLPGARPGPMNMIWAI